MEELRFLFLLWSLRDAFFFFGFDCLPACFLVCEAKVTRGRWREVSGPARICKQDVEKSAGLQYYMSSCRQGGVAQLNI